MKFCYEIAVPHTLAFLTDDGDLTREQVIEQAKAIAYERQLYCLLWEDAVVSEAKDDY